MFRPSRGDACRCLSVDKQEPPVYHPINKGRGKEKPRPAGPDGAGRAARAGAALYSAAIRAAVLALRVMSATMDFSSDGSRLSAAR